MEHESIESSLKEIRDLMKHSKKRVEDGLLELTEDDLVDESDEDAYIDQRTSKQEESSNTHSLEKIKNLMGNNANTQAPQNMGLEELVKQSIKPMLQEWIDKNLAAIVEKETQKIIIEERRKLNG